MRDMKTLVDVSDIFNFFSARGRGRGSPERQGGGVGNFGGGYLFWGGGRGETPTKKRHVGVSGTSLSIGIRETQD